MLPHWADVWPALQPWDDGYTFDGQTNPYVSDKDERMRYARMLSRGLAPIRIAKIGVAPKAPLRSPKADHVVPSSHYGLIVDIEHGIAPLVPPPPPADATPPPTQPTATELLSGWARAAAMLPLRLGALIIPPDSISCAASRGLPKRRLASSPLEGTRPIERDL